MMTRRKGRTRIPPFSVIGAWQPDTFLIATWRGVAKQIGRTYAGLGMAQLLHMFPPTGWILTHLGTGHEVCQITAHEPQAFALADQIAALGDWDFDGLEGWRNRDPDLMQRLHAFLKLHPEATRSGLNNHYEEFAREIAMARTS